MFRRRRGRIVVSLQRAAAREREGTKENTMNTLKHLDTPGLVFGAILLFTGVYYVLRNTFGLPLQDINWDNCWPFIVVAIGGSIVFKTLVQRQEA
jgi:hypothetical protein